MAQHAAEVGHVAAEAAQVHALLQRHLVDRRGLLLYIKVVWHKGTKEGDSVFNEVLSLVRLKELSRVLSGGAGLLCGRAPGPRFARRLRQATASWKTMIETSPLNEFSPKLCFSTEASDLLIENFSNSLSTLS